MEKLSYFKFFALATIAIFSYNSNAQTISFNGSSNYTPPVTDGMAGSSDLGWITLQLFASSDGTSINLSNDFLSSTDGGVTGLSPINPDVFLVIKSSNNAINFNLDGLQFYDPSNIRMEAYDDGTSKGFITVPSGTTNLTATQLTPAIFSGIDEIRISTVLPGNVWPIVNDIIISTSPLPLEITSFTAYNDIKGNTRLHWQVATDKTTLQYDVEESNDAIHFIRKSIVPSLRKGESQHYSTTFPASAENKYYRIKQVDLDGQSFLSQVVKIEGAQLSNVFDFFPNPVDKVLTIKSKVPVEGAILYNSLGRNVSTPGAFQSTATIDFSALPSGVYFLTLQSQGQNHTQRLIKR